jgi:hypothetical protein
VRKYNDGRSLKETLTRNAIIGHCQLTSSPVREGIVHVRPTCLCLQETGKFPCFLPGNFVIVGNGEDRIRQKLRQSLQPTFSFSGWRPWTRSIYSSRWEIDPVERTLGVVIIKEVEDTTIPV